MKIKLVSNASVQCENNPLPCVANLFIHGRTTDRNDSRKGEGGKAAFTWRPHIDGNDFNDIQCPTNNQLGYRGVSFLLYRKNTQ